MSRWTEFASGFCPGGHYSLACIFLFTEYVPPLLPIIQGQTVSPSHVVTLSPFHVMIQSPSHVMVLSPSHVMVLSPSHVMVLSPSHVMVLSSSHVMVLSPSHVVSQTLSDDVVCTVWFLYVGCVMYIPLQDKKWEGWLIKSLYSCVVTMKTKYVYSTVACFIKHYCIIQSTFHLTGRRVV